MNLSDAEARMVREALERPIRAGWTPKLWNAEAREVLAMLDAKAGEFKGSTPCDCRYGCRYHKDGPKGAGWYQTSDCPIHRQAQPRGGGQHEELKGEIVTDLQKELRNVITFIGRKAQGCEDECDPEAGEDCALALRVLDPGGWLKEFDRAFVFGFACGAFAFGIPLLILFILNLVKP